MKPKTPFYFSLTLNLLFFISFTAIALMYRDKFFQGFVAWKGNPKIVMFGNSITAQGKWVELLGRTDVMTRALPGQCTYHFLQAIQPMVVDLHPEVCFVMGGINDITVGVSQEKIEEHYTGILQTLVKNKIIPVVTLTVYEQRDPVSQKQVKRLNEFLIGYCRENNLDFIDLNALISDSTGLKPEYAADKTHLNERAYKQWAVEIKKVLTRKKL